jgi:hypothetical protein
MVPCSQQLQAPNFGLPLNSQRLRPLCLCLSSIPSALLECLSTVLGWNPKQPLWCLQVTILRLVAALWVTALSRSTMQCTWAVLWRLAAVKKPTLRVHTQPMLSHSVLPWRLAAEVVHECSAACHCSAQTPVTFRAGSSLQPRTLPAQYCCRVDVLLGAARVRAPHTVTQVRALSRGVWCTMRPRCPVCRGASRRPAGVPTPQGRRRRAASVPGGLSRGHGHLQGREGGQLLQLRGVGLSWVGGDSAESGLVLAWVGTC